MFQKAIVALAVGLALWEGALAAPRGSAAKEPMYGDKPMSFWLKAVRGPDQNLQNQALWAITQFGPAAKAAVPDLLALLNEAQGKNDKFWLRRSIASALGAIGPDARPALPAVTAMLKEPSPGQEVGYAIIKIGGADAVEEKAAVRALLRLPTKCGSSALEANRAFVQQHAATLTPHLAALLKDEDTNIRILAAQALASLGVKAKVAVPALLELLKDKDPAVVAYGALALVAADADHLKNATATLVPLMAAEPGRRIATYALQTIGPKAAPLLVPALADKAQGIRDGAREVLGALGAPVVPLLVETLASDHPMLRAGAAGALGHIPSGAPKAVPALLRALKDTEAMVRFKAAVSLVSVNNAEAIPAVPVLIEAFQKDGIEGQMAASAALRSLGPKAKSAGPALREILQDLNERIPTVRCPKAFLIPRLYVTALTLESVDHDGARPAIPALIAMVNDPQADRAEAATVLSHFGRMAMDAVPALKEALKGDPYLVCIAAQALAKIAPDQAQPAVVAVLNLLKSSKGRGTAGQLPITTLAILGPLAKDTAPVLEKLMEGSKKDRAYRIAEALVKVDPKMVPKVIAILKAALLVSDEDWDEEPLEVLCDIAPASPREVLQVILEVIHDPKANRNHKFRIAYVLGELGPEAKDVVVPVLTELGKDKDKSVVVQATRRLKRFQDRLAALSGQPSG